MFVTATLNTVGVPRLVPGRPYPQQTKLPGCVTAGSYSSWSSMSLLASLVAFVSRRQLKSLRARHRDEDSNSAGPRFFLDSASVEEWRRLLPLGMFYGVTTNPVLLQREGHKCTIATIKELYEELSKYELSEVMFQTWGETVEDLYENALKLRNVQLWKPTPLIVKFPLTRNGIIAASKFGTEKVDSGELYSRFCMTACYSAKQAIIASGLKAAYIAPYLGRMSDQAATSGRGSTGPEECLQIQTVMNGLYSNTRVLVASIRSAQQLVDLSAKGCDTFTFAPAICDELLANDATTLAAEAFEAAAREGQ